MLFYVYGPCFRCFLSGKEMIIIIIIIIIIINIIVISRWNVQPSALCHWY